MATNVVSVFRRLYLPHLKGVAFPNVGRRLFNPSASHFFAKLCAQNREQKEAIQVISARIARKPERREGRASPNVGNPQPVREAQKLCPFEFQSVIPAER